MITKINPAQFLEMSQSAPIVDVRSPSEFRQGHVPGAILIPMFQDRERELIGTMYHKTGKAEALVRGLDFALDRLDDYLSMIAGQVNNKGILIHCWRGGMRSAAMAEVMSRAGLDVFILEGGYKAYRNYVNNSFKPDADIWVLGGYTGSGKTSLLRSMAQSGEQIIDIEALACHKGSVFGAMGQVTQPTNEQFENELFRIWHQLDKTRSVWVEDESRMIGNVTLPDIFFRLISASPIIVLEIDAERRVENLVREYAGFDPSLLREALAKLRQRLGGELLNKALMALEAGDFHQVAAISLQYYDKAYRFALSRRKSPKYFLSPRQPFEELDSRLVTEFIKTIPQ